MAKRKELPLREQHYHSLGLEKRGVNMRTYNTLVASGLVVIGQTKFVDLKRTITKLYYSEDLASRNIGPTTISIFKRAFEIRGKTHREELCFVESDYMAMHRVGWIVKGRTTLSELSTKVRRLVNASVSIPDQTNVETLQALLGTARRNYPKKNCESILRKLEISLN